MSNCTLVGDIDNGGTLTLVSTILKSAVTIANHSGTVISSGWNLSSDNGGGFLTGTDDQINTDPKLDPAGLQDNGGPTQTIALIAEKRPWTSDIFRQRRCNVAHPEPSITHLFPTPPVATAPISCYEADADPIQGR